MRTVRVLHVQPLPSHRIRDPECAPNPYCNPAQLTSRAVAQHRFTHTQPQWGFARYISNDALRATTDQRSKPILENDTLDIVVFVRVLRDPTGVLMHDFRESARPLRFGRECSDMRCRYDSKAVTGYVPLVNQGATDYLNAMLCTLFMNSYYRKVRRNVLTQPVLIGRCS